MLFPVNKNETWPAVESVARLFPDVFSCIGSLLTLALDSANVCTDRTFQLTEVFALGQCAVWLLAKQKRSHLPHKLYQKTCSLCSTYLWSPEPVKGSYIIQVSGSSATEHCGSLHMECRPLHRFIVYTSRMFVSWWYERELRILQ